MAMHGRELFLAPSVDGRNPFRATDGAYFFEAPKCKTLKRYAMN